MQQEDLLELCIEDRFMEDNLLLTQLPAHTLCFRPVDNSDHAIFTGLFHGKDFLYTCKRLEIYQNNWMGFQGGGPVFPKDRMPQQCDSNMA